MIQPMDEEAQAAIREALAADDSGAMLEEVATRPSQPPAFDDAGSYLTQPEIAADNDKAALGELVATPQLQGMTPQMGGQSQVTLAQREEIQKPSGGFDWGRALWAAGGGDLGSFDAQRNREQDRQDKQVAAFDAKQLARQGMDPQSEISRQRQSEYAQQMQSRAQIAAQSGMGELARTFAEEAKRASTMSATQIDRASQTFGGVLKESMGAAEMAAKQQLAQQGQQYKQDMLQATIGNQSGRLNLDRAELGERVRHDMATEEHARNTENKAEVKLTKAQQEKLNQEISDLTVASNNMQELLDTKKKVNTGPLAGPAQKLLSKVDLASDDYVNLRALGARVFNKETKTLAGSAVSPSEWARIAPQIPDDSDDDRTYELKMRKALEVTKQILEARKKQYQMLDGKPVDRSVTAQENTPRQLSDQDRQALEWANANPDDPRAAKIKQKLGVK